MTHDKFKVAIEARLRQWLQNKQAAAPTDESRLLLKRAESLILRAGKRSRPALLHMTYQAYGGQDSQQLIDLGLALELHHQFLLVHDDIMDNDTIRYDGPNITGYYQDDFLPQAPEIPPSMALLAGNLLFTFACQAIIEHPQLANDQKLALLELLQDVNIGVHAGQQLDIVNIFALSPVITKEKLLLTNLLKTALYSVKLPMQMAGQLLQLDHHERDKIDVFAKSFGVLYQLVDDHSDYFSNESSFDNHPKYRDFRQGKITYPLLVAFETIAAEKQLFLREHIGRKQTSDSTMLEIVKTMQQSGAEQASKELISDYFRQTKVALDSLNINPHAARQFDLLLAKYQL